MFCLVHAFVANLKLLTDVDTIVHFKRLGNRHFEKEMKIQSIVLKNNMKDKPTTMSDIHSKGVKSSPLSNLMHLKVR